MLVMEYYLARAIHASWWVGTPTVEISYCTDYKDVNVI